ncbi:hypothetical protein M2650_06825 [Luteimonas sp. SX5]|uniref:Oxidoreductase n=1 Tax=Luteimonas galliterrae TaxID=2940486 RepID=A0ABT0MHJ4_9GAMM|nr:hypothetical protein [Luteimonas galliterrae]MCL1634347.1 hypothetical protein [Luteimonas galliterrae]
MSIIRIAIAAVLLFAAGAACAEVRIVPQDSGVKVRLRGISAVSDDIAWASGREGTVLRTVDGGKHWQTIKVPDAGELDFRDVEGFDADTAVVLSIGPGEASRVYRTEDGGKSWKLALQNKDPRAFFDCMAFDGDKGWMMGDPVEGRFQIYATTDAGRSWELSSDGPKATKDEAAFAASGTCISRIGDSLLVATGGAEANIHLRSDDASVWRKLPSGLPAGKQSAGVFSVSAMPMRLGFVVVGGDFEAEAVASESRRFLVPTEPPASELSQLNVSTPGKTQGYRSGVACAETQPTCIAVGPSGVDVWKGTSWETVSKIGYDAIDFVGDAGWASGNEGRLARVEALTPIDRVSGEARP